MIWLAVINSLSLLFVLRSWEARFVFLAWVINAFLMTTLFDLYGFTRILGLSHVVAWSLLVDYLWRRRKKFSPRTAFGLWAWTLLLSNSASLVIDYADVVRFILGADTLQ